MMQPKPRREFHAHTQQLGQRCCFLTVSFLPKSGKGLSNKNTSLCHQRWSLEIGGPRVGSFKMPLVSFSLLLTVTKRPVIFSISNPMWNKCLKCCVWWIHQSKSPSACRLPSILHTCSCILPVWRTLCLPLFLFAERWENQPTHVLWCVCMHVYLWRSEVNIRCLQLLYLLFLTESTVHWFYDPGLPASSKDPLVSASTILGLQTRVPPYLDFYRC